ncbi:MAG: hypothetical protein CV087_18460 [Candidatus Brocadia sp. WS118]|nr:MAG: hypothetical protein CV087_18460 [Candidatus Brocadia sp. WS118]
MIGIRTKLMLFTSTLVIMISTLSCLFFLIHAKRQEEEALKNFGMSLIMLLAQDNEVRYAMTYTQPAFLDTPVKRIRALDREEELGYLRISNIQKTLIEEKATWMNIDMKEIPTQKGRENQDVLLTDCTLACSRKVFYDFSLAVAAESTFSEEAFAAQVLEEIKMNTQQQPLGFIQIGLSSHKLSKRIHEIFWKSIIPLGLIIISGGISITIFLTKYLVSPLRQMADVTLDIAKGDLTRTVDVQSQDEMGQLSVNFNKMTRSLKKSYDDLKQEIADRRRAEELLAFRVKIEGLITAISANFINLPSTEVDAGIHRALKQIGEFSGVDRSYVFLNSDGGKRMDNTHEWCARGIQSQKENLQGVLVEQFPWGMEKLRRFETIHIPRVNDLPDDAMTERALQQSQQVQSCVIVPMIYGGSLFGLLGFDSVRREKTWTHEDIGMLKIVAEIFVNALEHKRMEEALRISEGKYRMLLENLPQRIFYKDENLRYVSCNENYARDLKIHTDEIQGKTDYDFYPEVLAEKYRSDDKRIMRLEKTEEIEEKYINNGQELTVHTVKTPIKDEKGSVIGVLGIFWDITEKIALQTEAIRSRHLVSVGELAAGVAHEINNPITGIINCAQILVNKSEKGTREEDIGHRIVKEGNRIADIVKSLLSFARPGDRKEQRVSVHVSEIMSDTLVLMGSQLKKDNVELVLNIPPELSKVSAHHQQIQQVFLNLISNARYALNSKYPGRNENKILEIRGESITINNRPYVKVTFHDKGTGISADILDKVMNPFFSTKPRGTGTGLGLSISHGIVNDHGGKLLIDSVENEFTKVTVVLPSG